MTVKEALKTMQEGTNMLPSLVVAQRVLMQEIVNPAKLPTWKRSRNLYEEPCIGSAFEKTGRRFTALYMGGYFIDLDDLYDKLPKEDQLEDEE